MRFKKSIHLFLLSLAACAVWLASTPAALATAISNPLYEEPPVFLTHLAGGPLLFAHRAGDPAGTTAGGGTATAGTGGTGTAATAAMSAVLDAIPTSPVPEPTGSGLLFLGAGSLLFLKFGRRNRHV